MSSIINFLKAAAPVVAPIAGGYFAGRAAKKAADTQAEAGRNALMQYRPYAALGDRAAGILEGQLTPQGLLDTFGPEDFETSPGYQWRMDEGLRALDNRLGAMGLRRSGRAMKEITRFGQGLASDEYARAYDRFNQDLRQRYNMLAGPTQLGSGVAGNTGNVLMDIGNVQAAGNVGATNALTQGVNDAIRNYQLQQIMRRYGYAT